MGLGQVFVVGALALAEVGHGVQPQAVDADVQPEVHDPGDLDENARIVEVQVRLMREEAVPVVGLGHRVPGPVGHLGVAEDDPRALVLLVAVAPDVVVAKARARARAPGPLEPRVLVGRVVDHQLGDHLQPAPVRLADEEAEVADRAVRRVDVHVVGDVVAVVAQRRRIERQQPDGGDAEVAQVVELLRQPAEIADTVAVGRRGTP